MLLLFVVTCTFSIGVVKCSIFKGAKLHTKNCTCKYLMHKMQNKMQNTCNMLIISMLRPCENFPHADAKIHGREPRILSRGTPAFMAEK